MRILSVHNCYQVRGGEDESRELEQCLLREMGHEVEVYEEDNERIPSIGNIRLALKTVWSQDTFQNIRNKIHQSSFNVIHVQNFFPLISPSVYYAARLEGIPVVQTLRNYRLLCPNALFFRDGHVCEDCLGKFLPWPGVLHACYRGNRAASGTTAAMITIHRMLGTWHHMVNAYITLTEFARQKFIEGGIPSEKIFVKPNFVHPDPGVGEGKGEYALFIGRLSVEKGLDTLLSAWKILKDRIRLKIVGDGPLAPQVADTIKTLDKVEWLGRRSTDEVYALMGEAKFLILPSKWYETFGRVAMEAFAKGTPVIAAKVGAIAELVDHNRTGLHFMVGDPEDLASKVDWLLSHSTELSLMRHEARTEFETKYTSSINYLKLMEIYTLVSKSCLA